MNNNINDLKKIYDNIEIPDKLDQVIDTAILRGKIDMKRNNSKKRFFRGIAGVAAAFTIFTVSVNTVPAFASKLENVPGLGSLVKVLQFNKGESQGGEITDGADINGIILKQGKNSESILIGFDNEHKEGTTPYFDVKYKEAPCTMLFSVSGVRGFTAEKYFDEIKKSKYVKDIYRIITLDDSQERFNIVFNSPIKFTVEEYKNPGSIKVDISKDESKDAKKDIYSIRTKSYQMGEDFSIIEEILFQNKDLRTLKDEKGTFLYELGNYETKAEAERKLQEFKKSVGELVNLSIEKRTIVDMPKQIK